MELRNVGIFRPNICGFQTSITAMKSFKTYKFGLKTHQHYELGITNVECASMCTKCTEKKKGNDSTEWFNQIAWLLFAQFGITVNMNECAR